MATIQIVPTSWKNMTVQSLQCGWMTQLIPDIQRFDIKYTQFDKMC